MTQQEPPALPNPATIPPQPAQDAPLNQQASNVAEPSAAGRLQLSFGEWRRVSPRYVAVAFVSSLIVLVVITAGLIVLGAVGGWDGIWWILGAVVVIGLLQVVLVPRRVRSIGYQLRDDDLVFRRGILWQRIVAVPYGRMQLVDINRGPLARWLGLAELKLVTAAAATGVAIPGLPVEDAEDLRDHLVRVAESRRTGL